MQYLFLGLCVVIFFGYIVYGIQQRIGQIHAQDWEDYKKQHPELFTKPVPEPQGGCPCCYVEPCNEFCPCKNKYSSGPCYCCCKYGSLEQRKAQAAILAGKLK